jgi:hypothetical protein
MLLFQSPQTACWLSIESWVRVSRAMQDKKIDERDIDRVEGNSEVKKYLKETWKKLEINPKMR